MKKVFLIITLTVLGFVSKAQTDNLSIENKKEKTSFKKNELGIQGTTHYADHNFGVNYTRFITRKVALKVELGYGIETSLVETLPIKRTFTEQYRISLGAIRYFNNKQKGFYVGFNVDNLILSTSINDEKIVDNALYIFPEVGYTFLVKKRFIIQPYIAPIGLMIGSPTNSNFLYGMLGLRLKYRF